jgi:5-methylthioadenosine/S-adenosylhomocysteine deaminase
MDYVLNGATIVPMTGPDTLIEDGAIVVDDGEIQTVSESPVDDADASGELIDLDGRIVIPGLINAHTHLYQTLLRATWEDLSLIPWLERVYHTADVLEPMDCYVGSRMGVAESIRSGVTTLLEHQFLSPSFEHQTATVDALLDTGIRSVYARTIMDEGDIVPASVTETPEAALDDVAALLDEYGDEPRLSIRTGPNTPPVNTSTECCRTIAEFCAAEDVGISAHVSESPAVVEQVREEHGYDGVAEYLDDVGLSGPDCIYAHCVHLTDDEVTLLVRNESAISHNPVSNMMLGDGVAPIVEALDAGVTVGLGTDGAASTQSQDMVETMKTASMLQKVHHQDPSIIGPYDVLEMATIGGARALGLGDRIGTIEAGKRADLTVVDLESGLHNVALNDVVSQLVHTMKSTDVVSTMVDGEFLMRDGTLLTVDERALRRQTQRRGEALQKRVEQLAD